MNREDAIDSVLVHRYQLGDTDALGVLFVRHEVMVANILRRSVYAAEDVRDLVQDVFLRAMGGLSGFRGACTFRTWLVTIALNAAKSHTRRSSLKAYESLDDGSVAMRQVVDSLSEGYGPEDEVGCNQLDGRIQGALQRLPESFRTSLALREHCCLSYEEVSEIVGCSVGTTRSRIHRAREAIHSSIA